MYTYLHSFYIYLHWNTRMPFPAEQITRLPFHIKFFLPQSKHYPDSIYTRAGVTFIYYVSYQRTTNLGDWFKALGRGKATDEQQNPQAPESRLSITNHTSED